MNNPYVTEPGVGQGEDDSRRRVCSPAPADLGVIGGALALLIATVLPIVMLIPRGSLEPHLRLCCSIERGGYFR